MTGRRALDRVALAAESNARWCDAVCRAHGLRTSIGPALWVCHDPPPRFHSMATTLADGPEVEASVRALIEERSGPLASVKDGFFAIDLAAGGWTELFRAQWLWRAPAEPGPTSLAWRHVRTDEELRAWDAVWEGGARPAQVPRQFPPAMLDDPAHAFMAGWRDGRIVAVSILDRTGPVVGLSNTAGADPASDDGWADHARVAAAVFPGSPLMGYERGADLAAAERHGFLPVGPLRVWMPPGG